MIISNIFREGTRYEKTKKNSKSIENVEKESIFGCMLQKGYTRKEFLQFCSYAAATAEMHYPI